MTDDAYLSDAGLRTVMVPVAIEMLRYLARDWSEPVQIRIETDEDGKHTMVLRAAEPQVAA